MSRAQVVAGTAVAPADRYRWVMLGLVWSLYFVFGLISTSLAPVAGPVMGELGLNGSQMGFVLGAWQLVYIGSAYASGFLIDQLGLRRSLVVGALLMAASGLLRAAARDFATLVLAVAVFGMGGPMVSVGSPKLAALWFRGRQRGTALGLTSTASPVGSVVILATASSLLVPLTGSWRGAVAAPGVLALLLGLLWWLLARDPPGRTGPAAREPGPSPLRTLRALWAGREVRLLLGGSIGLFAVNHGLIQWLPRVLQSKASRPPRRVPGPRCPAWWAW